MRQRFGKCGFIKPVGQQTIEVERGVNVDKDVSSLRCSSLVISCRSMSTAVLLFPTHPCLRGASVNQQVVLMRRYFNLEDSYTDMSPVVIPPAYTRAFIDGKITDDEQRQKIVEAFGRVSANSPFTVGSTRSRRLV